MKKKFLLIIAIASLIVATGCQTKEKDNEKFAKEYTQVSEYNVYKYKNSEEIIKILKHGTGIVYLGFPECPWCQAYVPMLNEVADTEGLETIYYYNIYEDRKQNTETYKELVEILSDYLQYDNEGNKRIYVPAVIAVEKGKIVGFNDESSYDTKGFEDPKDYWQEEDVKNLKSTLSQMINEVIDNKCSDCNK